jgi:hypothetical protein
MFSTRRNTVAVAPNPWKVPTNTEAPESVKRRPSRGAFLLGVLSSAALVATFLAIGSSASAASTGGVKTSVVYSSLVARSGNLPSFGAEAYAFNEFGNEVTLAGTNRQLTNAVVTLSSWGCVTGHWYSGDCDTPAGSTFSVPITLNIYNPAGPVPGTRITTVTQTFAIPYRPSANTLCSSGRWYDNSLKTCFNGLAVNVTFNLANVTVPDSVVYGIVYNTTHYGPAPIGETASCYTNLSGGGCGYDSLNIAVSNESSTNPSVGSDPNPGTLWQNSPYASRYCDGGGTISVAYGFFRLDSPGVPCWAPYTPAVQFKAGGGHS